MKKLLILLMLFTSCYNCSELITQDKDLPKTEVFVQGKSVNGFGTKSLYVWPYDSGEGWETARFSIRVNNNLPGYTNQSSDLYFGRKPGVDGNNRGKVSSTYPYGHYNDRNYDYYKRDKVTGNNIGLFRYVYDSKGLQTQFAILEAPHVVDILVDEYEDIQTEIDNGKNVTKNTQRKESVTGLLQLGHDYLESHILWYVVKEVGMKGGWHVNGILVDTIVGKPGTIPDNVEIDIHQQEHLDWNQIKTSIHVRTDVESISINIPLDLDDIIEQDDFDIRIFTAYFKEYKNVECVIIHDTNGITIEISGLDPNNIESLKQQYGDGITIEIFSYCKSSDIWDKLKKSHVITTGKSCTVIGQITSAYNNEKIPITVMNP